MSTRAVEGQAIKVAEGYAQLNGYAPGRAAGLVLVGMAIMATCDPATALAFRTGYLAQLPDARDPVDTWAALLDAAAKL